MRKHEQSDKLRYMLHLYCWEEVANIHFNRNWACVDHLQGDTIYSVNKLYLAANSSMLSPGHTELHV